MQLPSMPGILGKQKRVSEESCRIFLAFLVTQSAFCRLVHGAMIRRHVECTLVLWPAWLGIPHLYSQHAAGREEPPLYAYMNAVSLFMEKCL